MMIRPFFRNNGRLPEGWAVERLTLNHQSQLYNPDIANAFFRAGMIEAWGRGIRRIMSSCQENNNPAPVFRYEYIGLWVEFSYRQSGVSIKKTTGKYYFTY
ncbi:ATP-binding protein [Methanoplanus limicola]|uniref:ATP-binding protein n=1 Tax=Methanoplanus limicola TaxID=2315 RepID=UPI001C26F7FF